MASRALADRLANYAATISFDRLSKEAIHETKRRFIDSFATAVGAMPARRQCHRQELRAARVEQSRRISTWRRSVER